MQISKRALQIAIVIAGIVPVAAGLVGIGWGPDFARQGTENYIPLDISLDSHFRYLSGLLLGIGLTGWTLVPHIERNGTAFRMLAIIVFIGGLGRLWAVLTVGMPDHPMLFGLTMELVVTPALALWQLKVARQLAATPKGDAYKGAA